MKQYINVNADYILPFKDKMTCAFRFYFPSSVTGVKDLLQRINDTASVRVQHHCKGLEYKIVSVYMETKVIREEEK
jgi:hypothetical protein